MTRLTTIDPATAPEATKSLLGAVNASLGITPNLFRVAANSPAALQALVDLIGDLSKGALRAACREAIALAVAQANRCDYCLSVHSVLGAGAGLSADQITGAREGHSDDPKLQAALELTLEIVRERGEVGEASVERAKAAGLSEGEIVEIVAHVALNVFTNYLNKLAHTAIDFPPVHAAALV